MKLTFYGQSCFAFTLQGKQIIVDPFISPNEKASQIDVDSLKADYVLLTHAHQDHVADAETIARNNDATIIAGYEVGNYYDEKGINYHPLNHGGKWKFDFGTVKMVSAIHSSVFSDGTYGGNPGGFVIWNDDHCFYIAGDTALTMDMKLIPMTCPPLDFAILPIGDNFTMGYEDAVIASDFVNCDTIVGCHFDTFGYITIDHDAARKAFSDQQKKLIIPEIGKEVSVG